MNSTMDSRTTQLVCRTCLKVIVENELYINADSKTRYGNVIDILETCVSELNLDLSDEVVMCCNCITMLKISYEFKLKCLDTEDKIYEYQTQHNLPIFSKINLVDVVTNSNHLENDTIDLRSEQYRQNETSATGPKKIAESIVSTHCSLADMNYFRKDNSCQENEDGIIDCELYENAELNRTENSHKPDYNDGILMFDDLTNADVDNLLRTNYNINPVSENDTYRDITNNIEHISHNNSNPMDCDMNFEGCRLTSSREEYCESLFKTPPSSTREIINVEDSPISEFVFKSPLTPIPKRQQYYPN